MLEGNTGEKRMANNQVDPHTLIEAMHEGILKNLNAVEWHYISGKTSNNILKHFKRMIKGDLNITPEQCVGLVAIDFVAVRHADKAKAVAMSETREKLVRGFFKKGLAC